MISQTKNRVQAIKSKFENLNCETESLILRKVEKQLCKHEKKSIFTNEVTFNNENDSKHVDNVSNNTQIVPPEPNTSYLYSRVDTKRSDSKKSLTRQISDPGKKLHRSHAFRCDRSQKVVSPKRHGSCNGRSETSDFTLKMGEKKLSKERLKRLGNLLEDQMKKENFIFPSKLPPPETQTNIVGEVKLMDPTPSVKEASPDSAPSPTDSIPDKDVPKYILDQYAKVVKPKKKDEKADLMTDSGVSSETENLEEERGSKIKRLTSQFEKTDSKDTNLEGMNNLCASSETMKLERKNPHLILTDTLKKALKQPLPPGPPPKKPPRTFGTIPETPEKKKDAKKMLEKLEQVLQKREAQSQSQNIYDEAETDLSIKRPKEVHYLCTEILDITQRTLLPNQSTTETIANCFNSLNCAVLTNSTASLPYTRLSSGNDALKCCSSSYDSLTTENIQNKCPKCVLNDDKDDRFKCHLSCKCKVQNSEFYVEKEHIYDEPCNSVKGNGGKGRYGTINSVKMNGNYSKSLEDLRMIDDKKLYDIPCDVSRAETPDFTTSSPKSDFQKLRENFEAQTDKPETETRKFGTDTTNNGTDVRKDGADLSESRKFGTIAAKPEMVSANIRKFQDSIRTDVLKNLENISEVRKIATVNPEVRKVSPDKPVLSPKPNLFLKKVSKSSENLVDDAKNAKRLVEKKFGTEAKRFRNRADVGNTGIGLTKKNFTQLDMDRENLNRLMNEIYETVTAACNMDERKPCSFPTDHSDGSTSEDSVKLTRSLTEKRKNYVRRVSSRVAYLDQANLRRATRHRHLTSICSYKSEAAVVDNPYSTFRSWKSFRASQTNVAKESMMETTDSKINLTDSTGNILSMKDEFDSDSIDKLSIDEKTGCVDIELPFEPREKGLFNVCLLVGLNYMTGQAYVKSVFPSQVQVPPHIENLIFPETLSAAAKGEWSAEAKGAQCYSLVLTDERGERSYGYCRRVLPEGASTCLPLCYCLIGRYRAPGFYYKVLQEIESHHGSSEVEIHSILQQLFEMDFPNPGEEVAITYKAAADHSVYLTDRCYRNSVNLGDVLKCKTMPDMRRSGGEVLEPKGPLCGPVRAVSGPNEAFGGPDAAIGGGNGVFGDPDGSVTKNNDDGMFNSIDERVRNEDGLDYAELPKFLDLENNNGPKKIVLSLENQRTKVIKRPIEPRVDEDNLSTLLDSFGAGLVIKVFGSLLLERKVIIISDQLSVMSSCMEALQSALYPFVWQQPLICSIPAEIQRDVLEAPLPILAGALGPRDDGPVMFEEGMLIDLSHPSKALFYQGDEATILPSACYKTLKTSLQMETSKQNNRQDTQTRNVMISEAFLRFFVDMLGEFWRFFSVGELKDGDLGKGNVIFDKEAYIKSVSSKQNQYFLEWFTETAMFNHFIQNMAACYTPANSPSAPQLDFQDGKLVDTPLPNFYELFYDRLRRNKSSVQKGTDKNNYKSAVNKRVKLLKTRLKELVT